MPAHLPLQHATTCSVGAPARPTGPDLVALDRELAALGVAVWRPDSVPQTSPRLADRVRETSDALRDEWEDDPPAVVHTADVVTALAVLTAAPAGVRFVHSPLGRLAPGRGVETVTARWPGADPDLIRLEALLLHQVDAVVATSSEEFADLLQVGVPRAALRLVPVGVDTAHFSPSGPAVPRSGRSRVLTVTQGGGEDVGPVLQSLAGRDDVELVVLGGGLPGTTEQASSTRRVRAWAERLGAEHRVVCVGDVPDEELPAWLRSADCVVLCRTWTNGDTVVRAMACGRAVVCTDVGGARDAVVDGATGSVVPVGDRRALHLAVAETLASDVLREGRGLAAVQRVEARYAWRQVAPLLAELYRPGSVPVDSGPVPRDRRRRARLAGHRVPAARSATAAGPAA